MRQSSPIPWKEATPTEVLGTPTRLKTKLMHSFDGAEGGGGSGGDSGGDSGGGRLDWSFAHKELLQHTGYDLKEKYEMRYGNMGVWKHCMDICIAFTG